MLELNQEYTYKKICEVLGWKESSGNQKKKQIKEVEDTSGSVSESNIEYNLRC